MRKVKQEGPYWVVEFPEEETVEVVPSSWVISDELECRFPLKITAALRKQIISLNPPNKAWEVHRARVIKKCVTYAGANKCANILMDKECLDSDWTENELEPLHRKRKPTNLPGFQFGYLDQSDLSDDNTATSVNDDTTEHACALLSTAAGSSTDVDHSINSGRTNTEFQNQNHCIDSETTTRLSLPANFQLFQEEPEVPCETNSTQLEKHSTENRKFFKLVLTKLANIERDIADIKKLQLCTQNTLDDCSDVPSFPLQSRDDLDDLEDWLLAKENQLRLKSHLGKIGGSSGEATLRDILRKVIAPELARQINFTGQNGKVEFQKLKLREAITEAARKQFTELTDKCANCVFINWFRNSKDLAGGREDRRDKNGEKRPNKEKTSVE